MYDNLASVPCFKQVKKRLPFCEHSMVMACSTSPERFQCTAACGGSLGCCKRTCRSRCGDCTAKTREGTTLLGRVLRSSHIAHPCERPLYCQHLCGLDCSEKHECSIFCRGQCLQRCGHHSCSKPCGEDCAPCGERCEWICPHGECPVLCGSVCFTDRWFFGSALTMAL